MKLVGALFVTVLVSFLVQNVQTKSPSPGREEARRESIIRSRRAPQAGPQITPEKLENLLKFVKVQKRGSCTQRVICELVVSPKQYGDEGVRFANILRQLAAIDNPKTVPFKRARSFASGKTDPKICYDHYKGCTMDTLQFIKLGLVLTTEQ